MRNVLEWLDAAARRSPDAVAFADEAAETTFAQTACAAAAVATCLATNPQVAARRAQDPCVPVAVFARKGVQAVAALLGTVAARGYYCVLDDRQPLARLASIVATLGPAALLVDAEHADRAAELLTAAAAAAGAPADLPVIPLEEALATPPDTALLADLRARALDVDPLYVNFTSGSTGTPKGVLVAHRSVIDFIGHFTRIFGFAPEDRIANQAPLDFDVSVKDIYGGLCAGAAVHLVPREYFSVPVRLMDFLCDRGVTVCTWAVSALCFVSIMGGFDYRVPASIRRVIFSGEVMPPKQLAVWRKHLPDALFANVYGPTEVTCNCTYYVVERDFANDEVIPMGKPFPNEEVFLLDEQGRLVPPDVPGVEGEICVAGTTLALGYLNDPQRTAAAFVPHALHTAWPARMYRTGDVAVYDKNADLVYRGRVDHQVKHMGQRIELGEIEAAAHALEGVARACCLYDARKKRLLLFYEGPCAKEDVKASLAQKLPQYMVPGRIRQLEHMPLTKNGKIDRGALQEQAR